MSESMSKNGGFVGIEINFSTADATVKDESTKKDESVVNPVGSYSGGLVGGYQYYFGESQKNGLKVSAHLYAGYATYGLSDMQGTKTYVDAGVVNDNYYFSITYGADIKYLFDALEIGKNTLGFSVGVGYEATSYMHINQSLGVKSISITDTGRKPDQDFTTGGFYPVIGVHYYYGHNQFEVLYRFGGALAQKGDGSIVGFPVQFNTNDYISLNYAYRF